MKNRFRRAAMAGMALGWMAVLPGPATAQLLEIFTEDLSAFNSSTDLGDGVNDGVVLLTDGSPFGTGVYVRYFDFNPSDKPETQGELPTPILGPFQLSFQSVNQSVSADGSPAIRWRMANSGVSIASQANSAFSLSWHADRTFSASYLTSSNTIASVSTPPQSTGVHAFMVVGNGSTNESYAYTRDAVSRTLDPLSYDVYIDGELLNSDPAFAGGLGFAVGAAAQYNPAMGLKRFGLIGSSDANVDPDVLYDNILLNIGEVAVDPPITGLQGGVAPGFAFPSAEGAVYVLQSSTNATAAIPVWVDAGMQVTGNGAERVLFDPAGHDSGKTYRIVETR